MSENTINIDERIFSVKFCCNLAKCKGACCTVYGALGAPIKKSEIFEIKNVLEIIRKYLDKNNLSIIDSEGFYIEHSDRIYLNNVGDRECVFSFWDNDIAKCSFQESYNKGEIKFKKPVSCELFPIREYNNNCKELRYEKTYICEDALVKGEKMNISIFEFVKEAIIREYGEEFYNKNEKIIKK